MNLPVRRHTHTVLPDLAEIFETITPFAGLRPLLDSHTIRIEDKVEDGKYVLRAEIPGVTAKDLNVSVHNGLLTVEAERSQSTSGKGRSEFRYGSFSRTVSLPAGAAEDEIRADYADGILTVAVALAEQEDIRKHIEVNEPK
ncbi:Hsp20/alpha crystallin family protein [Amycolatopsis cihanbeyliensis]|uniref:HSP20 family molecular chaperone IbpA n=1 Tax=Amycolatopsis cihanbeyliensis TaxID=1128664 RepID=A0A542DE11_AMYCI|nr:Hsp20/alpha crystallin family protein [Amycolatopsis cihanbeyliensis]TQJ01311.1 HSP20 family molecular chaperone IbpA [Amycolatopsis cihanbeyliensis]